MLWKIENTPHKILGSIHALPETTPLPSWVETAYRGIERVVFEGDPTAPGLAELGVDREGAHLAWSNASSVYARAKLLMESMGNDSSFDGCKPWKAAFFVTFSMLAKRGVFPKNGIEHVMRGWTQRDAISVDYLESAARPLHLLESCGEPYGCLSFFDFVVSNPEFITTEFNRILKAWSQRDLPELEVVLAERLALWPLMFESLVNQRNAEWAAVAARFALEQKPTLFAVGALHCVGEKSFLHQMASRGFRVSALD